MIGRIGNEDVEAVLEKLNISPCRNLYILADLIKYGPDSGTYRFFFSHSETTGAINWVMMRYLDTAQLVVFENAEIAGITDLLGDASVVFCDDRSCEIVSECLSIASIETGWVARLDKDFPVEPGNHCISLSEDFDEIAKLICTDDVMGRINTCDALSSSIKHRYMLSFVRSYVIEADGRIVCHAASYAETHGYAVISGVITMPQYRKKGYATSVVRNICRVFQSEGKDVYLFWYKDEVSRMYHKEGFKDVLKWHKIFLSASLHS